jgi:hypothetical protein
MVGLLIGYRCTISLLRPTQCKHGLLATNTVRQGGSAETLKRIKETGDIFLAYTDKPWILEGASLRVSIIGFDDGSEKTKSLNDQQVMQINADLTSTVNLDAALTLQENLNLSFRGHERGGPFLVNERTALTFLQDEQNKSVIHPWFSGRDLTDRPRNEWVIDFGELSMEEAEKYKDVFVVLQRSWEKEQRDAQEKGVVVAR